MSKLFLSVFAGVLAFGLMVALTSCDNGTTGPTVAATITSVTVAPKTVEIDQGTTQQFTATVVVTGNASQAVAWTIVGNHKTGTTIDTNGVLTVAADETANATLTIKATSNVDTTKSDTATVTVREPATEPTVRSVSVDPVTALLDKGGTQQFTANVSVSGTPLPATTVIWSLVEDEVNGTALSIDGLLTVGVAENRSTLTVVATSTELDHKSGSTVVTVIIPLPTLTGTVWIDKLNPESTITFTAAQVTTEGEYWKTLGLEKTYQYSNASSPEIAKVAVYTDVEDKKGFELWYYPEANGKDERLVVYLNGLQPREFFKQ